jgi:hypothetical protein
LNLADPPFDFGAKSGGGAQTKLRGCSGGLLLGYQGEPAPAMTRELRRASECLEGTTPLCSEGACTPETGVRPDERAPLRLYRTAAVSASVTVLATLPKPCALTP